MLEVRIYNPDEPDEDPCLFEDIDYVSLISDGTYGPPPLIAPGPAGNRTAARARVGEVVLYINPRAVPLFSIERTED